MRVREKKRVRLGKMVLYSSIGPAIERLNGLAGACDFPAFPATAYSELKTEVVSTLNALKAIRVYISNSCDLPMMPTEGFTPWIAMLEGWRDGEPEGD